MSASPEVLLVVGAAVAAGALVQSAVGFGLGLIAVPFLALIEPELLPGPLIFTGATLAAAVMIRDRAALQLRGVQWALAGRVVGNLAGAALLAALPASSLSVFFAVMVLVAIALSASGWRIRPTTPSFLAAGTASGVMGTTTAIGGPPMALVYQDAPGQELRSNISAFFVVGSFISIASLAAFGQFEVGDAISGAALLPAAAIGFLLSPYVIRLVDRGRVRSAVWLTSGASSVLVLARELWP
jgi:uncharacterized membrane protein YfcA